MYDVTPYHVTRGYVSESEGEEMVAQEVTLPQDMPGRGNLRLGQSVVRLTEVRARLAVWSAAHLTSARCDCVPCSLVQG